MKLVVTTFLTLDGIMQAPGGPEEDRDGGFAYGGWLAPFWNDACGEIMSDTISRLDALLLGRRTYEIFAGFWPNVGDEDEFARRANRIPKYVLSTTLTDPTWSDTQVLGAVERVKELKAADGQELQVHGSATALQTLLGEGLVDEIRILQAPIVLGTGKRLFGSGIKPTTYEVTQHRGLDNGLTFTVLGRGTEVQTGNFAEE